MIRQLSPIHKQQIINFCLQREQENLFILGSFKFYTHPFKENYYIGYFNNNTLQGIAVIFKRYKSFVINAKNTKVINELVDYVVEQKIPFECIPAFKKYAAPMIQRLREKHNIIARKESNEIVMTLKRKDFISFATGEEEQATPSDIDKIALINRKLDATNNKKTVSNAERKRVNINATFLLREDGKIASKANLHGFSEHYFQIGGMITLPEHRCKGYAKRVLSNLCQHYFDAGIPNALLFTARDNIIAQKVYTSLGFRAADAYIIAEY